MTRRIQTLTLLTLAVGSTIAAQDSGPASHRCEQAQVSFKTIDFPPMRPDSTSPKDPWLAHFKGTDEDHTWRVFYFSREHRPGRANPSAMFHHIASSPPATGIDKPPAPFEVEALSGPFGALPYAMLGVTPPVKGETMQFLLTGISPSHGYAILVQIYGVDPNRHRKKVLKFLTTGIKYAGPRWNPKWTTDEAEKRWRSILPRQLKGAKLHVHRTPHYIMLGNSKAVRTFGKTMEGCYKRLAKIYPIPKVRGRRLLPVYLFATAQDFTYYMAKATGQAQTGASRSLFRDDFYATWTENTNVDHHLRGVAFQYMRNRLHFQFGASWFNEGVMNFPAYQKRTLTAARDKARKNGRVSSLRAFMELQDLWHQDPEIAFANYRIAGSILGCIHHGRWARGKWMPFLRTMARLNPTDVNGVETGLHAVFGFGIDELEKRWKKW